MDKVLLELLPFNTYEHRALVLRGKETQGLAVFRGRRCLAILPLTPAQSQCLKGVHVDREGFCSIYEAYRALHFEHLRSRR